MGLLRMLTATIPPQRRSRVLPFTAFQRIPTTSLLLQIDLRKKFQKLHQQIIHLRNFFLTLLRHFTPRFLLIPLRVPNLIHLNRLRRLKSSTRLFSRRVSFYLQLSHALANRNLIISLHANQSFLRQKLV